MIMIHYYAYDELLRLIVWKYRLFSFLDISLIEFHVELYYIVKVKKKIGKSKNKTM